MCTKMAPSCKWPIIKLKVCDVINWPKYNFSYWNVYQDSVIQFCHSPYIVFSFFPLWKRNIQVQNPEKGPKKGENLESSTLFNLLWIYSIDSTAWWRQGFLNSSFLKKSSSGVNRLNGLVKGSEMIPELTVINKICDIILFFD